MCDWGLFIPGPTMEQQYLYIIHHHNGTLRQSARQRHPSQQNHATVCTTTAPITAEPRLSLHDNGTHHSRTTPQSARQQHPSQQNHATVCTTTAPITAEPRHSLHDNSTHHSRTTPQSARQRHPWQQNHTTVIMKIAHTTMEPQNPAGCRDNMDNVTMTFFTMLQHNNSLED